MDNLKDLLLVEIERAKSLGITAIQRTFMLDAGALSVSTTCADVWKM